MLDEIINKSVSFDHKDKDLIKNKGVVFTPLNICDTIIERLSPSIDDIICEPSVGKGAFVFSLLEYFRKRYNEKEIVSFVNNNLYCYDINPDFIGEFKSLLKEYFNELGFSGVLYNNIMCFDYLLDNRSYDIVMGNPPYVRIQNLDKDYLNSLRNFYSSLRLGNVDLYYVFIEKALMDSKRVGFIIPNSFIKNKSGEYLRNLLLGRVSYVYDFGIEMVWDNISTYTCLLICDKESNEFEIESSSGSIVINNWDKNTEGENTLIDLIHYHSIGLATLRDNIFKKTDGIEIGITRRYIKATKSKSYLDYDYIIYPYDNDGNLLSENTIKELYPNCYQYLLSNKEELLSRDGGKTDMYESWYCYGRKQGMLKDVEGTQVILPLTFLKEEGFEPIVIPDQDRYLVLSGISVFVKTKYLNEFIDIVKSKDFIEYCEENNRIMKGKKGTDQKWLTITSNTIKNFRYDLPITH